MAVGSSFTNLDKGLALKYDKNFRGYVGWSKGVLAGMVNKVRWGGKQAVIPIRVGNSPARSADFTTAQNKASSAYTALQNFTLSWNKDYGDAKIDGLLMDAASQDDAVLFDDMCAQIDGILDGVMHSFSTKIYRNGYGAIGVMDATTNVATQNIILQKREDLVLFEVGMDLQLASTDHASVLRAATVITVDQLLDNTPAAGQATVHVTAAINTIAGAAAGDTIFASGDRQNSATPSILAIPGLDAWLLPATALDFTGINRATDFRLQGTYVDATSGMDEETALIAAVTECGRFSGKPKEAYLNPTRYQSLINKAMARLRPTTVKSPYGIGLPGVTLATSYGDVDIFSDPYCPVRRGYIIDPATFKFYGVGSAEVPRFLNHDKAGNILRLATDDGVEARTGYYGTTGCNAPIKNAVIVFEAGA